MENTSTERAFSRFVKSHHVHYSVEPEWAVAGGSRKPIGFSVRLFAVHDKGARALPACPKSRALAGSLRSLAEALLPTCTMTLVEIEPFSLVLYGSREVPGADEVALTIRLSQPRRYADPVDASAEPCLKQIRESFKVLSLPER